MATGKTITGEVENLACNRNGTAIVTGKTITGEVENLACNRNGTAMVTVAMVRLQW